MKWREEVVIEIGRNVCFNVTATNCFERKEIGDMCAIAEAFMIDGSARNLTSGRRSLPLETVPGAPVRIGRNMWNSTKITIFRDLTTGINSTVDTCSLITRDVPPDAVVFDNHVV